MAENEGSGAGRAGRVAGKVIVVTGAARGIGRASAVALAREGAAAIVGIDVAGSVSATLEVAPANRAELDETGRRVEAEGARWLAITLDQRDIGALRRAADETVRTFGGIDVLFANAGIQAFKPLLAMEDADWHDTIDVNLNGTANAMRAFGPHIVKRGGGRIIVTSSTQGQHGTKYGSAYSASKWGLIGLAKSAALELGEHKVTVNVVVPGLIDTPLTRHRDRYAQAVDDLESRASVEELEAEAKAKLTAKTPLGVPWIEPEDVAPVVVFLASDESRMVSGTTFAATGGDSANLPA